LPFEAQNVNRSLVHLTPPRFLSFSTATITIAIVIMSEL
jgi:hypothetical protein